MIECHPLTAALELPAEFDGIVCSKSHVADHMDTLSYCESQVVTNAVEKRRREYSTGRWLAHRVMRCFDVVDVDLLPDENRQPQWPSTLVGSITHTDTCAAVAVARKTTLLSVGIDMEHIGRVDQEIVPRLLTPSELRTYTDTDPTLLFSAKEACYKFLFPLTGEYVDYQDVEVTLDFAHQNFSLRYVGERKANAVVERAFGAFRQDEKHWICCVAMRRR